MSTSILGRPTPTKMPTLTSTPTPSTIPAADPERCALLGPTALLVQALMGVFVLASLIAKRQLEKRKRPWRIWTFDVSKQLFGQGFVHASNVFISALVAHLSSDNPCSLYFLNVLVDTTLGVFIIYLSLHLYEHILIVTFGRSPYFKSGSYGSPPRLLNWARQLIPYLSALITMKLCVVGLFAIFPGPFVHLGNWVLDWMSATSQVIFVMMIFPLVMNVLQFCLVDQILKSGPEADEHKVVLSPGGEPGAYERLPTTAGDAEEQGFGGSAGTSNRRRSFGILNPNETTPIPSSPLLGEDKDRPTGYGSATPSPRSGASAFELPPGLMARKKAKGVQLDTKLVLGGAVEIGLPKDFTRNGIDQAKVVLRSSNGAVVEIYKLTTKLGLDTQVLHDRLISAPPTQGSFHTDNIILPSPFTASQQQITTATIIRARQEATSSFETVAILSDGPQATTKLIVKLVSPTDASALWFEATVASVRVIDLQAWASCVAHELDWE